MCKTDQLPSCGPGAKPILLDNYCQAFPLGAKLEWVRAGITVENSNTIYSFAWSFMNPAVAYCPAGANGTTVWYPAITSFKGRVNCLCTTATSCYFTPQGQGSTDAQAAVSNLNSAINLTFHGEHDCIQGSYVHLHRAATAPGDWRNKSCRQQASLGSRMHASSAVL